MTRLPRDGRGSPSASRTTMPAMSSWIAIRAGVPSRPASAVMMPLTETTLPTGTARAAAMDVPLGVGIGVGVGEGVGDGVGVAVGTALGEGVGGVTEDTGVGLGGGAVG